MGKKTFTHQIQLRFKDLDALGHVNNANYLSYVELCRVKWMETTELYFNTTKTLIPIVLAHASIDFIQPATLSDTLEVETSMKHVGTKSFSMSYHITSKEKGVIAKSEAILVWYNHESKKGVAIPDDYRAKLEQWL